MKNHKEINQLMEGILGEPKEYDLRHEFRIINSGLTHDQAYEIYNGLPYEERHLYSITTAIPNDYADDAGLAIKAAKRLADKNECTFVLNTSNGEWKAAFGDYGDCAEYSGGNPAYVICMAVLQFMGKL